MDQLELLATAIVCADNWTPRRWLAKYGAINLAEGTHLNKDYKEVRKAMLAQLPKQRDIPEAIHGLTEHSLNL
ncbi:TPA: hypothetical protein ACQJT5_004687 [Vibrio parahaemolyticus]